MRAPDGARAEGVHERMVAAGVAGDDVTYNTLIKALSYTAEANRGGTRGGLLSRAGGAGAGEAAWELHKVRTNTGQSRSRFGGTAGHDCRKSRLRVGGLADHATWAEPGNGRRVLSISCREPAKDTTSELLILNTLASMLQAYLILYNPVFFIYPSPDIAGQRQGCGSLNLISFLSLQVRWMMEAGGYQPAGTVWGSLITACGKAGQLGCAEALWAEMQAAAEPRTAEHYHALMNACVWTYQVRHDPAKRAWSRAWGQGLGRPHLGVAMHVILLLAKGT